MTPTFFIYWVIPVLLMTMFSRFTVNLDLPQIRLDGLAKLPYSGNKSRADAAGTYIPLKEHGLPRHTSGLSSSIDNEADHPERGGAPVSGTNGRAQITAKINEMRAEYKRKPDVVKAIELTDIMEFYGATFQEGMGLFQQEAVQLSKEVVKKLLLKKKKLIDKGEPTDLSLGQRNVAAEVNVQYPDRSVDGLLCKVYTSIGKMYFLANMFESSVKTYNLCLDNIEPNYLPARNLRGNALVALGRYKEAGVDFAGVINLDKDGYFTEAFEGLASVLVIDEDAVPGGWGELVENLENTIPQFEYQIEAIANSNPSMKKILDVILGRFHHVMFTYHDTKSKNYAAAWNHLARSNKHKMAPLPPWPSGQAMAVAENTMKVFSPGFWAPGFGSRTNVPIFIVGFAGSGSTLLEGVLEAHPNIVGMGENSVVSTEKDNIRDKIIRISSGGREEYYRGTEKIANDAVIEMMKRWKLSLINSKSTQEPQRLVDRAIDNINNVGMIHMLYPKALILHVVRKPMDVLLSSYKNDFAAGHPMSHSGDLSFLAEQYLAYRSLIEHWDKALPGRVTHVRYDDMVNDMPNVARAVIKAAELPWNESVLDFHKKKRAANEFSSTQGQNGVYADRQDVWKRYQEQLRPLTNLIGDKVTFNLKTTLPGYVMQVDDEVLAMFQAPSAGNEEL